MGVRYSGVSVKQGSTVTAIEQFEGQATNRLQIAAFEEYEDSGTTPKEQWRSHAGARWGTLGHVP